jgi:hypothetical protein
MPLNLIRVYSSLLEIVHLNPAQRTNSLMGIFTRDIETNPNFKFRDKQIRPIKKEGQIPMQTLFTHLTTREDQDLSGKKLGSRSFEMARSIRMHWIKYHVEERKENDIEIFSYSDRVAGKSIIRTYIYDTEQEYVLILEPQHSGLDYFLITAYHCNEPGGKKQIENKLKKKLPDIH